MEHLLNSKSYDLEHLIKTIINLLIGCLEICIPFLTVGALKFVLSPVSDSIFAFMLCPQLLLVPTAIFGTPFLHLLSSFSPFLLFSPWAVCPASPSPTLITNTFSTTTFEVW